MKFIITNTYEGFLPQERDAIMAIHPDVVAKRVGPNDSEDYILDIPIRDYPCAGFSISGITLYCERQWIGTLSERFNALQQKEDCVFLNQKHAFKSLKSYAQWLLAQSAPKKSEQTVSTEQIVSTVDRPLPVVNSETLRPLLSRPFPEIVFQAPATDLPLTTASLPPNVVHLESQMEQLAIMPASDTEGESASFVQSSVKSALPMTLFAVKSLCFNPGAELSSKKTQKRSRENKLSRL